MQCVAFALGKEFRIFFESSSEFEDITVWRKIYYDYSLSEDSFIEDIEEPLRLSEEEKITEKIKKQRNNSPAGKIWGI